MWWFVVLFDASPEFPEFQFVGEQPYILDQVSEDDDELQQRGEQLKSRASMDVSKFKIRTKEGVYALYIR